MTTKNTIDLPKVDRRKLKKAPIDIYVTDN